MNVVKIRLAKLKHIVSWKADIQRKMECEVCWKHLVKSRGIEWNVNFKKARRF